MGGESSCGSVDSGVESCSGRGGEGWVVWEGAVGHVGVGGGG